MSRDTRGTKAAWLAIGILLLIVSGCARHDWIDDLLVTVNVSGASSGTCGVAGGGSVPLIEMALEQDQGGPKVTGRVRTQPGGRISIEGTVSGDVFRYSSQPVKSMLGEFRVSGDEMSGWVSSTVRMTCELRRQPTS